jgi:hypothetical protein
MLSQGILSTIDAVLRARLQGIGYERADVKEATDHDGDPILRITIYYKRVGDVVDPSPTFSLARHLREALIPIGENRFPHFTHRFPDDQELKVA